MTAWNITLTDKYNQTALIDSGEFVRAIVQEALQEFLLAEVTECVGAEYYERTDMRTGVRNGYKPRTLNLRVGSVELRVPQTRDSEFHTELFERYQRSEQAFTLAIVDMWLNGVSTRKVACITDALSSVTFSKSAVSELCKSLDAQVGAWRSRDLSGHAWPYVFVDALYENVRRGNRVVSAGILIATGVRDDGVREVLDVAVADTESAASYDDLFSSLRERGVSGVQLVTSDDHAGLKAAIRRYFQGAAWQRCQVHFVREALGKASPKGRGELAADLAAVFDAEEREEAMVLAAAVADKWRAAAPRAAAMVEDGVEECLSALSFPEEHRERIRTNNAVERLNREIRRRDRAIGVFPNEESALRLVCMLCIEQSEEWLSSRPYLDMGLLEPDGGGAPGEGPCGQGRQEEAGNE